VCLAYRAHTPKQEHNNPKNNGLASLIAPELGHPGWYCMSIYHIEHKQNSSYSHKTNKRRSLSQDEVALLEILIERWPRCFDLENPAPLQVGLYEQIIAEEPALTGRELAAILRWYVRRIPYTSALARGGKRTNLDGKAAGAVSEEHQIAAYQAAEAFGLDYRWLRADWPTLNIPKGGVQ
jgi:hypothetical protein